MKFFKCATCGNIVTMLDDKGPVPSCCNAPMTLLKANTNDTVAEKHVPVVDYKGLCVKVTVGSVMHPMSDEHMIDWIGLETNKGFHVMYLKADSEPTASFRLVDCEKAKAVYAYCNVHGLWMTDDIT